MVTADQSRARISAPDGAAPSREPDATSTPPASQTTLCSVDVTQASPDRLEVGPAHGLAAAGELSR